MIFDCLKSSRGHIVSLSICIGSESYNRTWNSTSSSLSSSLPLLRAYFIRQTESILHRLVTFQILTFCSIITWCRRWADPGDASPARRRSHNSAGRSGSCFDNRFIVGSVRSSMSVNIFLSLISFSSALNRHLSYSQIFKLFSQLSLSCLSAFSQLFFRFLSALRAYLSDRRSLIILIFQVWLCGGC